MTKDFPFVRVLIPVSDESGLRELPPDTEIVEAVINLAEDRITGAYPIWKNRGTRLTGPTGTWSIIEPFQEVETMMKAFREWEKEEDHKNNMGL